MIYINYSFQNSNGGGNSFLNRLQNSLKNKKFHTSFVKSKVIIFNSHHRLITTLFLKLLFPKKYFIHRVDGPISLYTGKSDKRDKLVLLINKIADFTIFQSRYSYYEHNKILKNKNDSFKIINNGTYIKNKNLNKKLSLKIKIIISSWSPNFNKGFEIFKFLDENINQNKFEIDFYGNCPLEFKYIRQKGSIGFEDLEDLIQNYDLAIIASKNDPCSNFLIECINSDLDILAFNSGGHPELISNKNCLFETKSELFDKLKKYKINNYKNIIKYNIDEISNEYIGVCKKVLKLKKLHKVNLYDFILLLVNFLIIKIKAK